VKPRAGNAQICELFAHLPMSASRPVDLTSHLEDSRSAPASHHILRHSRAGSAMVHPTKSLLIVAACLAVAYGSKAAGGHDVDKKSKGFEKRSNPLVDSGPNYEYASLQHPYGMKRFDPLYGMKRFDPLYGMKRFDPLSGMKRFDPLYGMKRFDPLYGMKRFDPLYGMKRFDPLYGMKRFDP
uniref:Secreted protein n=1 Tax=Macrostomum lignano TaxID=282301 RepID=A0A1I8FZM5_9PLAT